MIGLTTQHACADRMEGSYCHLFGLINTDQLFQSLTHLAGSLIGERHR